MPFEFKLPDLGEGVHEGEIVRWLVAEGDTVDPEQPLVEVMTDKVTAELPSPVGGKVLKLHGSPGDVLEGSSVLVTIEANGARPGGPPAVKEEVAAEMPAAELAAAEKVPPANGGASPPPPLAV